MADIRFFRRDDQSRDTGMNKTMTALLIAVLCFLFAIMLLVGALLHLRKRRRARLGPELPLYEEKCASEPSIKSSRRGFFTARIFTSAHVLQEKQALMDETAIPPDSPVPEIRITLPEEYDSFGKRRSGRVVIVRFGENGEGLEPVDDNLPAYEEKDGQQRFQSVDLERVGGLVEKARNAPAKI